MVGERLGQNIHDSESSISDDEYLTKWAGEESAISSEEIEKIIKRRACLAQSLTRRKIAHQCTINPSQFLPSLQAVFPDCSEEQHNYILKTLATNRSLSPPSNLKLLGLVHPGKQGYTKRKIMKKAGFGAANLIFLQAEKIIDCLPQSEKEKFKNMDIIPTAGMIFYPFICASYGTYHIYWDDGCINWNEGLKGDIFHIAIETAFSRKDSKSIFHFYTGEKIINFREWDAESQDKLGVTKKEAESSETLTRILELVENN